MDNHHGGCEPDQPIVILPCPPPATIDPDISIESACPDRVALPGCSRPRTLSEWLKALADQFCTLNPLAIRSAKPCEIMVTTTDPRGGSMMVPRPILDALNCAPFSAAGQSFVYDGKGVTIATVATPIKRLSELIDGPLLLQPGAFLKATSANKWDWVNGCLPPCPTSPGLVLQSTTNGGMQWGPAQPPGLQCKELKSKLVSCLPTESTFPNQLLGFGGSDACDPKAAKYDSCSFIRTGLKQCLTPNPGQPTQVVGLDADGNPWKYTLGSGLSCATMKITFPIATTRAVEVYGNALDGACGRFVRECDQNFRATARPATDVVSGNRLIKDWGTNSLYAVLTQDYNTGTCAGTFTPATVPGGLAFYTVASAGRYHIEASSWVNVRFDATGPGIITPDSIWAILMAIVISSATGGAKEYRIGESSDSIDYVSDPSGAYTINNCTKGLTQIGKDFFFSRSLILDLPAGATISVPRARVNPVYKSADIGATISIQTDGETSLAVTKLASPSF